MRLIVLSAPAPVAGEIALIHRMMEEGLECLHLRKPLFSRHEMECLIREISPAFHKRLVLHSHPDLAVELGLLGVHGNDAPSLPLQRSKSFHSTREMEDCRELYDYVFLSPIFDSISKPGYRSAFSFDDLRSFLHRTSLRVIALGGVEESRIDAVRELGFAGAAVLGAVWQSFDPVDEFRRLRAKCA